MKIEDYPITVGDETKSGDILRVEGITGEVGFVEARPSYPSLTSSLVGILEKLKGRASLHLRSYQCECPGKVQAQKDYGFWSEALEQERQKEHGHCWATSANPTTAALGEKE